MYNCTIVITFDNIGTKGKIKVEIKSNKTINIR